MQSLTQLQELTSSLADELLDEPIPEELLTYFPLSLVSEGKRPEDANPPIREKLEGIQKTAKGRAEGLLQLAERLEERIRETEETDRQT